VHGTIDSLLHVEWRPLAALAPIADAWRALAANAIEPNAFYEPAFALAAQPLFGRHVGAGLVWSREAPPRLLGLFPAQVERHRYGVPLPVLVGWTHPYGPLGAPLVDREAAAAVIAAWLDHIANDAQLPKLVLLPFVPLAGAWAQAFDSAAFRQGGRPCAVFARHQRALLNPGEGRTTYLRRAMRAKKRKVVNRQRARLAEAGTVTHDSTGEPHAILAAVGDFLDLEASGWKGRAGTAARCDPNICQFLETAVAALAGEGKARVDRLLLDAYPIAAIVTLRSGDTVWGWKIAYDENFAHESPGVQLLLGLTQTLLDDPRVARADSCATAGHPMIDHIWREHLLLGDRLVDAGAGAVTFAAARALEALRRAGVAAAKGLRDRLRP
jgi:Acetyltransferase (GNAT) domain